MSVGDDQVRGICMTEHENQHMVRIHDGVLAHLLTVIVVSLALSDFWYQDF
jgi:hypothetical protein